jgi:glycosyltransferase involved in cell wall biosynthesis
MKEMNTGIKLSSVIIAKNEEKNIGRCIESQSGLMDEIIVIVDKKSTDSTADIVNQYPCTKLYIEEWKGYADTKKYAVSLAENDWIFWIDADEEITPELKLEIKQMLTTGFKSDAYNVARKAFFLGKWMKHSGWYPSRVTRLFNRNSAEFTTSNVHEQLIVKGTTGELKNDLHHYTDSDIKHYFDKFNNYTTLAAEDLLLKNKKFRLTDITIRPLFLFIKMYIVRRGFMDGLQGFLLAVFSSLYVFTKYSKLWELRNRKISGDEK